MKKYEKVIILNGKHKGETGDVITAIKSEGEESVLVELNDGTFETFDFEDIKVI
ncbi:hypothetical protein [Bacillus xiapuensis]|uniref:KOW domain-containing protein n=1 Tax=Bacillus xiapuensis TaxID=2014075 RepID=A0ABU6N7W0_9BACI|nr:hypothetical protein [Bacillus xiapuensis]